MMMQFRFTRIRSSAGLVLLTLCIATPSYVVAQPQSPTSPVMLTDRDLERLSPSARKEVQALIAHKMANPEPKPERIRFQEKGIVKGDIGPGGVDIQLLGGAIRIGGKNRRPQPKTVAQYHPPGVPLYPEDLVITMVKRGNEPLLITLERGSFSISMTGQQLEQMIEKYKPYVVQMLRQALEQSGEPVDSPDSTPSPDLGAPAESDLGAPSSLQELDLGKPAELPGPDLGEPAPIPGKDETLKKDESPEE